jgi:hypothetical protein
MSMIGDRLHRLLDDGGLRRARQYVENLRESIHQHRVDSERASMPVMDRDTASVISSRLKGTPKEIAYALSLFELAHDRKVHRRSAASCVMRMPRSASRRCACSRVPATRRSRIRSRRW